MKKELLIITLVLVIGLLVVGCGNKQTQQLAAPANNQADAVKDTTPVDTVKTAVDTKVPETPIKAETPVTEIVPKEPAKLPVSQEELNSLKSGIEGIQPEDLAGIQ